MGLSSAFNTSLNGMSLNEITIDVLSNNVANSGTNGFKSSEVLFATQLARTLSVGSRPTDDNGGTNPRQLGLGASVAAIRKDFTQGSVTTSSSPSDLAIEGDGFFVLQGNGETVYTRAGNFNLNSGDQLVSPQGFRVQGYGVDTNFELQTTSIQDIEIPVGNLTIAQQTSRMLIAGSLSSSGDVGTQGTLLQSDAMTDVSTTNPVTAASTLADVRDGAGAALFTVGETLSFSPRKGGRTIEAQTLEVTATTTIGDLITLMSNTYGIHSGGAIPNDGGTGTQPGVTLNAAGQIEILGNMGTANELDAVSGDLTSNSASVSLSFTTAQEADGEGALTDLVAYDSLGEEIILQMSTVLESATNGETTFRYFVESADDSDASTVISTGTVTFNSNGVFVPPSTEPVISIDRTDTAAQSPLQIELDFSGLSGVSTNGDESKIRMQAQDGSSPGTLSNFLIDDAGIINGIFDNGVTRTLGQVVLARFPNTQGLLENGDTTYTAGIGSGASFVVTPGTSGAGTVRAGAIELSNVDIGKNLVDLILASTNYRGNARVLGSVQDLVDELLILGR